MKNKYLVIVLIIILIGITGWFAHDYMEKKKAQEALDRVSEGFTEAVRELPRSDSRDQL